VNEALARPDGVVVPERTVVFTGSEHADAFFEVDEAEAPVVREIFRRYLEEDESIAKIGR
jgi:hypothetical protein